VSPNAGIYDNSWDIVNSLDTLDRRSIINTYKELLASRSIYGMNPMIQELTAEELETYEITVVVVPDTNILKLTVDGPDPNQAMMIARAISVESLDAVNKLYPVYNFSILDEPALPTEPIRPQTFQNAALALFVGAIIGIGLAFSREQLQNTFEQLRLRSIVDNVSSAFTRAFFERRLREEITMNPDSSLSMGLIYLRGLEDATEVLPKALTDRVLLNVTETLKNELRGRDIVGRWSENVLSVLLPSTPVNAVEGTFKRLQTYLAEPIHLDKSGDIVVHPTPCIGVVSRNQFDSSDEVIERAESAMSQASSYETPAVIFLSKPFVFDVEDTDDE
jgi:diguanylate cyclase (GGDEF)-like protein